MRLTKEQLAERLLHVSGAQIVTLEVETDARLRKTHPTIKVAGKAARSPYADHVVTKRTVVNGVIGFIYENSVNRQQCREGGIGEFEAQPRKWGERIAGTPLVEHAGKLYLEVKVERVVGQPAYFVDGVQVGKAVLEDYLPQSRSSAESQGVDREVVLRDYAMDSIRAVVMGGQRIEVAAAELAVAGC